MAAGDLLVHPPLTDQAAADARAAGRAGHDFTRVLAAVGPRWPRRPGDLPHGDAAREPAGPFTGFPIFSVPPQLADAAAGPASTPARPRPTTRWTPAWRASPVRWTPGPGRATHTGTARSAAEAASPNMLDVAGVKVGQLSYTFSFNGIARQPGKDWSPT